MQLQRYNLNGKGGQKMKRNICLLFCLFIICSAVLCACTTSSSSIPASNQTPQQNTTPIPQQVGALVALPSFADLIDKVQPSVVSGNTQIAVRSRYIRRTVEGAGSGWIFDESGIIVTNNHVVEGATSITVQLSDGRTYTPVSVKADPTTDLAVLKINAGKLPALKVGDSSKLRVGDWVVAVGNALGMGIGVKNGIVSRLEVDVQVSQTETYNNLIETNAAINPGNSGGPLLNLAGEVIGITSLKLSTAGVEGMGYAININDAMPVIQQLSK
jgi:S1-C subfamily serine protease